ncbi:MAG: heparinase II/III family protein [Planktomarina sp.]
MKNPSHHIRKAPTFLGRLGITKARFGRRAKGFSWHPPPEIYGNADRGRQILSGVIQSTGHVIKCKPSENIWSKSFPSDRFRDDMHGFGWMNDLYAIDTSEGRELAKRWFHLWLQQHRNGEGLCWEPDLMARRMVHWINNGIFLLANNTKRESRQYFQAIAQHTRLILRKWQDTPDGKPRFEALCGGLIACMAISGLERHKTEFSAALCTTCKTQIGSDGSIKTRNPEDALIIYIYLRWVRDAFEAAEKQMPTDVQSALVRMGNNLCAIVHTNGELARFHGGGRYEPTHTRRILSGSNSSDATEYMGYLRAVSPHASLICDAAPNHTGKGSKNGHASIGAFEFTHEQSPIVVNSGSGVGFGDDWRGLCRISAAHSTLALNRTSSAQYAPGAKGAEAYFQPKTFHVQQQVTEHEDRTHLHLSHDAYAAQYGLRHDRAMTLAKTGDRLAGIDRLRLATPNHIEQFEKARLENGGGLPLSIRFHLHPEIEAELDLSGAAVSLKFKNGDVWVFRHNSDARLTLEPSMYLEQGRVSPWRNEQIVLFGATADPDVEIRWSFMQAAGVNDIDPKDPL